MSDEQGAQGRVRLLGGSAIRRLAAQAGLRPTKSWGQNFVTDANTVRRIARLAGVGPDDVALEVGPGLGSLTLALLERGARVTAVEIDPVLARMLPGTVAEHTGPDVARSGGAGFDGAGFDGAGSGEAGSDEQGLGAAGSREAGLAEWLRVVHADALRIAGPGAPPDARRVALPGPPPTSLVANLPYNVAVPVLLTLLARLPSLRSALVMVQWEVAERLAAAPGSKAYGAPSVKAAWYGTARLAGSIPRGVFWPVPRVDSGLVAIERGAPPPSTASREEVFACVDAAFAQRRKTLRAALAGWAGGSDAADAALRAANVDPGLRGERLDVAAFARIASAVAAPGGASGDRGADVADAPGAEVQAAPAWRRTGGPPGTP